MQPGIFLEILGPLGQHLHAVGPKANEVEALHARMVGLVEFCGVKASEIGAWIEYDTPGGDGSLLQDELLGSEISRPRIVSKSKLHGAPHLKGPPTAGTIAKLLSPSGAKSYRLPTMLSHLRYVAMYCADYLCRKSVGGDFLKERAILVRSLFKAVASTACEEYATLSGSNNPDDEIDLSRARKMFPTMFPLKPRDGWRNINAELKDLAPRLETHRLEARQLSAAFLLGDRPSLLTVLSASAPRAASRIMLSELARSEGPLGLWLRGAVGSGKSTILYQLSVGAAQQGWQTYFLDGLPVARLTTDLFISQIREHLTERGLIIVDNAEFLSSDTLLHISSLFGEDVSPDLPARRALVLATQTERLSSMQLGLLRKFARTYAYVQRELKRDKALYADRLKYLEYPSDIEPLADLIHASGLASRLSISEIRAELAKQFNDRSSALLLSSLISVIGGNDIRTRISDSIQTLTDRNTFAMVPGFDVFPGPIPLALGVIALCRYRFASLSRRKFFCDEHLISASVEEFFGVDTAAALSITKSIMQILWDETFFDVQYLSVSPTDPWRFDEPSAGKRPRRSHGHAAPVIVGGLVDTRHPEVTETIYRSLFRPSSDGIPAPLDEVRMSIVIGRAARKCALYGRVRHYEHSRTFLTLGLSFDSRVRDGYYDDFHDWSAELPKSPRDADLAARFCLEAGKAFIDSLLEAKIYRPDEPDRESWLTDRASDLLELAELHSKSSWRPAELGWLSTDVAAQRIRLLQLRQPDDSVVDALVSFFKNADRAMTPGNLTAICAVIRKVEYDKLGATEVLNAFETDCRRVESARLESPFYMELGRYARDVRPLTTSSALIDVPSIPDQKSQVPFFFREALRGENVADGWYAELYAFSAEKGLLALGEFQNELLDEELNTLRTILRAGLKRFERSVRLSKALAELEIAEAKKHIRNGNYTLAMEILGEFGDPALFTVRKLMRTLFEIQAERLPVSIASDFLPVLREYLDLEFAFGRLEPIFDEYLERYSVRWWLAAYLGGGQEGRISLSTINSANLHKLVRPRQLYELADALWSKGKQISGNSQYSNPLDAISREAAELLMIAIPEFQRGRQGRNQLRANILALDVAKYCKPDWLRTRPVWFAPAPLRDELLAMVDKVLTSNKNIQDVDRELILAAAIVLDDESVNERVRYLVQAPLEEPGPEKS
ncbi:hypothetical protein JJB98_29980 [Bradyrhizobium diazoefficiens]|nr:hypothetical protein [Bradyrhizobium diazoefficiens]QQO23808.1 hypothetical protein JJB98_29980 [Bradyrhizobium diazoefficiens]